jgi:hypothetical protein
VRNEADPRGHDEVSAQGVARCWSASTALLSANSILRRGSSGSRSRTRRSTRPQRSPQDPPAGSRADVTRAWRGTSPSPLRLAARELDHPAALDVFDLWRREERSCLEPACCAECRHFGKAAARRPTVYVRGDSHRASGLAMHGEPPCNADAGAGSHSDRTRSQRGSSSLMAARHVHVWTEFGRRPAGSRADGTRAWRGTSSHPLRFCPPVSSTIPRRTRRLRPLAERAGGRLEAASRATFRRFGKPSASLGS